MTTNAANNPPASTASGLAVGVTIILGLAGVCNAMQGVVGLITNEFYVATQKWIFQFDATTWGWVQIILGVIDVVAGIGLLSGAVWARILGVAIAAASILANFVWLPYYPLWAVLIIIFDVFVIWALTAHGWDVTSVNDR